ncbi:MAG: DNA polymerase III subunit alpha, partial [Bacteroidia bacterium]|nr:DNA polymerase III subunit alpha [Bacteroidia bacterium]
AFAQYAFNKSHSTCYAFVAYQTAYLKAHYPGEYMSGVLTNNVSNIEKISFFMEECQRIGVPVLGPDINESSHNFAVNKKGQIRFGMGAIKGVGESASMEIIRERQENGPYKNIFDLTKRTNLRSVSKKTLENLAKAGAFDFDPTYHRAQYISEAEGNNTGIDLAVRYGARYQENQSSNQSSLFGGSSGVNISEPKLPATEHYGTLEECRMEKEVVGIFISKHPLDIYKVEAKYIATAQCNELVNTEAYKGKTYFVAGMITSCTNLMSKTGSAFAKFSLEDYSGSHEFMLFGKDFDQHRGSLYKENFVMMKITAEKKKWGNMEYEIKILSIEKLEDAMKKYIKCLEITLNAEVLEKYFTDNLEKLLTDEEGDLPLNIIVCDYVNKLRVDFSADKKIKVTPALITKLDKESIEFKVHLN